MENVVKIKQDVYNKIITFVKEAKVECSFVGFSKNMEIYDFFFPYQTNSTSETTIDTKKMMEELIEKYPNDIQNANCWIHSHANMGTFWSGTDENNIREYKDSDYVISIVFNKAQEYKARLDIFNPIKISTELRLEIIPEDINLEEIKNIIKEKETIKHFPLYTPTNATLFYQSETDMFEEDYKAYFSNTPYSHKKKESYWEKNNKKDKKKTKRGKK